ISPKWFETVDSADLGAVDIVGHIGAVRAGGSVTWKVLVAQGIEPAVGDFVEKASGSGPIDGLIARVDLRGLQSDPAAVIHSAKEFDSTAVAVWVQAVAH